MVVEKKEMDSLLAYRRALLRGCGYSYQDLEKPLIAIVNSWNEINPGHIHLHKLSEFVKEGVRDAGGTPMEFNTIAICDGIANSGNYSKFVLPSREIIAASIESTVKAYNFDGMVMICSCDKIIPGHVCPEAYDGGPISIVRNGNEIEIDLDNRQLNLLVSEEEIKKRFKIWKKPEIRIEYGYLNIYRKLVSSAKFEAYLA